MVCKLNKAIYGLKQGSRSWNLKLDSALKEVKLKQSSCDSCVNYFFSKHKCLIVAVFVDDIVVFTNSVDYLKILNDHLQSVCTLKDLGPVQKCLGINIKRDRIKGTIELDQADYVSALLITYGMDECRPISTPMTTNVDTDSGQSQNKSYEGKDFPYQNAVGALLFLVQATRPDLAYAVSTLSQYNIC